MLLKLLEDKNGEVQNLAVKCLGPLVNKVKEAQVIFISQLYTFLRLKLLLTHYVTIWYRIMNSCAMLVRLHLKR